MKKAFTLVELLIVVVVLVTLMTITFRLSSIGSDTTKRNKTIDRLNRVENCLSGYYAAFGTYPPVALHGYRNIYLPVNSHGIQNPQKSENKNIWSWYKEKGDRGLDSREEREAWEQVKAACKSQPLDCRFPYSESYNQVLKAYSAMYQEKIQNNPNGYSEAVKKRLGAPFDNGWSDNPGRHTKNANKAKWRDCQLFKFGLMSYLLPRYLVMMSFGEGGTGMANGFADMVFGNNADDGFAQWVDNNVLPHDPFTGQQFTGWKEIFKCVSYGKSNLREYARVTSIPSQAVTARWLPNLEGIVTCSHPYPFYGIDIKDSSDSSGGLGTGQMNELEVYTPAGFESDSTENQFMLDKVTVLDGWGSELYYYSPAPHQSYTLWSAGANARTFPPWISVDSLSEDSQNAAKCVGVWVEDDITRMNN